MAIDITEVVNAADPEQLDELARAAMERHQQETNRAQVNRDKLLAPARVQAEIDTMLGMIARLDTWLATAPEGVTKELAIMLRRTAANVVALGRVAAGLLDTDETGV